MKTILWVFVFTTLTIPTYAQDEDSIIESEGEGKIHKIALVFGYTHIPSAFEEGIESESIFVPTIGLDYFVQFAKGFKVGVIFDLELDDYIVEFKREDLEREMALVTGILVGYEFRNHWSVLLGPGIEFEKNQNLFIFRSSVEYEFELSEYWSLFPAVNYDFKGEYSTWALSVGISKRF